MAAPHSQNTTHIAGYLVVRKVGTKTQSIRVRSQTSLQAAYSLPVGVEVDISLIEAQEFTDVESLDEWLLSLGATPLDEPELPIVGLEAEDQQWVDRLVPAVEEAIEDLLDGFLRHPDLHRVEHSLHAELFTLLKRNADLSGLHALGSGGRFTQLVHKEWPETLIQLTKGGGHGSFDLAVLTPTQVARADRQQFRDGRIEAPIVIELGLDYGLDHLQKDVEKFRNSRVRHPYLVHFSRLGTKKLPLIEAEILGLERPVQVAYAHIDPAGGPARYKKLADQGVCVFD